MNALNLPTAEQFDEQIAVLREISGKLGLIGTISSWKDVQAIVRKGQADRYFAVGDLLMSKFNNQPTIWEVIGINHDTPTDSNMTYSMTIQTRDCLTNIQFDAPEPTNPDTNRQQYGNNRYIHSAIRQWLNSNDDVFQWSSQHSYDKPPTGSIYEGPGFLKLLDPELAAVIGKVNKQVARNTITDGGGQDLFSDKVFLLSRVEAGLGTEGTTDGEEVYSYYDGIENAGRIKLLNGSPRVWWLRSPIVSGANRARLVSTSGVVSDGNAHYSYGLAPACCIV